MIFTYIVCILVSSNFLKLSHVMRNVSCHLQVLPNFSATVQPMFYVESWSHFPKERDRLLKLIEDTNVMQHSDLCNKIQSSS